MHRKELRIALICYGGISLAVYMHGVTRELWHLARASRDFERGAPGAGVSAVYQALLETIADQRDLRIRVLPDIVSGASAGGINAVFLAQALHSGQSLEPLTDLWLDLADVDRLIDPAARPRWRFAKLWAQPFAWWLMSRPGVEIASVAPETRAEVRRKVSHLIRSRWFEPPFSGPGFSGLLETALAAMAAGPVEDPLLPPGHPIDLFVTATDFHGRVEPLRLHSPPVVLDSEHRLPIAFRAAAPATGGTDFAPRMELVFAARATASFPGAFPPLTLAEIDCVARERQQAWPERTAFIERLFPGQTIQGRLATIALVDGSVLVNKPFGLAMAALRDRPAQREIDRRFVYIDPRPNRVASQAEGGIRPVGFFGAIFGSLSTLPREQPIRDNLEAIDRQGQAAARLNRIIAALRPEVETAVERLFGYTFFLDSPTPARVRSWRQRAQDEAGRQAGYAFNSYAQAKLAGIVSRIARLVIAAAPELGLGDPVPVERAIIGELERRGLDSLADPRGGATPEAIAFFREHDIGFRIRRLRLLARRLSREWEADPDVDAAALDRARDRIYAILARYFDREGVEAMGPDFSAAARGVLGDPGTLLDYIEARRVLPDLDDSSEEEIAALLEEMPKALRRRILLAYLGFPFYDTATLPLLHEEGVSEFEAIKVDRISPEDARSIRDGGTAATLRGIEFFNFGAFFSRAYRENDYLWGRLHGAERMIDLVASTVEIALDPATIAVFKRRAFEAILDEEDAAGRCAGNLIATLRREIAVMPS